MKNQSDNPSPLKWFAFVFSIFAVEFLLLYLAAELISKLNLI
jgi:hypothetical protein